MSNNDYGSAPPPLGPMMSNGLGQPYYYPQQQQQQYQSERISGDGEEMYNYDYMRNVPHPQGPPMSTIPSQMPPPMSTIPPPVANYNYEDVNLLGPQHSTNPYEQFEFVPSPAQQTPGSVDEESYIPLSDNRSADGEEQLINYNNPNTPNIISQSVPLIGNNFLPALNPTLPPSSLTAPPSDLYQPVGLETPQAFSSLNQDQRYETIGSAALQTEAESLQHQQQHQPLEDTRDVEGFLCVGQRSTEPNPRSIDGQEFPETGNIPSSGATPSVPVYNPNVYNSVPSIPSLEHEQRSRTIGSEDQVQQNSRSIVGQEQLPTDISNTQINQSTSTTGVGHIPISVAGSHHRSETLGSDTLHEDHRASKSKTNSSKITNNPLSSSETGDSVGRSAHDATDRIRRDAGTDKNRNKLRGKQVDDYDQEKSHRDRRRPSFEDDSEDDDNHDGYDRRRDRDYGKDRKLRQRGRDYDRSRRGDDWDSVSNREYRHHSSRTYDFEDEYRPRSRNSSYHDPDDYYSDRRRRRREHDPLRVPRSNEYHQRPYAHDRRPPVGYVGHPSSGYPSLGRSQYQPTGYSDPYATSVQKTPQQIYLERLRIENPTLYREWYHKYLAHMQDKQRNPMPPIPGFSAINSVANNSLQKPITEGQRVQSGRSSVADEVSGIVGQDDSKFRPIQEQRDPSPPARNTPQKFSTSHSIGVLTPLGHLVRVRNGGSVVEILNIKPLMKKTREFKDVKSFPGPLIKGATHKKTLVLFCQRKIRELEVNEAQLDKENLILLWELLILLLQQNGTAIGSDIAELLLKSKSAGQSLDSSSDHEESEKEDQQPYSNSMSQSMKDSEEKCIEVFCEKLIYGHKKEALDYAMDNGLWGHALFFASKMGEKTYGNVLARFANGMKLNSPLQTLYQVLSGKQPASVTCCCDESFGDWKPHVAMILSNAGERPDVEAKAITTLGDTLGNRNFKFAAQFCYLMAEMEFSPDSKIGSLLGFNPAMNNILEATQMTEIYEFARSLGNSEFTLGTHFIKSKLSYTKTLLDLGFIPEAYGYCEELTKSLRKGRIGEQERFVAWSILQIAERLVNCDESGSSGEPSWIEDLRKIADQLDSVTDSRKQSLVTSVSDSGDDLQGNLKNQYETDGYVSSSVPERLEDNQVQQNSNGNFQNPYQNQPLNDWNNQQQPHLPTMPTMYEVPKNQDNTNNSSTVLNQQQQTPNFINNGPMNVPQDSSGFNNNYLPPYTAPLKFDSIAPPSLQGNSGLSSQVGNGSYPKTDGYQQPHIRDEPKPLTRQLSKPEKRSNDSSSNKNAGNQQKGQGWLSGMFRVLNLKPKNQMILPDDKEPAIVWDDKTKTWKNTSGDDDEDSAPKGPPPKDVDLMRMGGGGPAPPPSSVPISQSVPDSTPLMNVPQTQSQQPSNPIMNSLPHIPPASNNQPHSMMGGANGGPGMTVPLSAGSVNKYQRPKGLSLRNNYVDVFNPNAQRTNSDEPKVPLPVATAGPVGMPNIFMPNPALTSNDSSGPTSFLSSSSNIPEDNMDTQQEAQPPQMFNPAQFQNQAGHAYSFNR